MIGYSEMNSENTKIDTIEKIFMRILLIEHDVKNRRITLEQALAQNRELKAILQQLKQRIELL